VDEEGRRHLGLGRPCDGGSLTDLTRKWNKGLVDSRDRKDLVNGECQQATGVYYKPGNPSDIHKLGGRSTFGDTSTAAKIDGLALCQFDSGGTDKLLALSGSVLYGATPGVTGTFASLFSPTTSPSTLDTAHAQDNWYLAMGTENRVLKNDGTLRAMGMKAPSQAMVAVANDLPTVTAKRPTDDDAGWIDTANMAKAYDTITNTGAHTSLSASGSDVGIWGSGWATNAGTDRMLYVLWSVYQGSIFNPLLGAIDTFKIEVSEDDGVTYTTFTNRTLIKSKTSEWSSVAITDSLELNANIKVRVTAGYTAGT